MTRPLPHQPGNTQLWFDQLAPERTKSGNDKHIKNRMEINMDVCNMKQSNGETVDQFIDGLKLKLINVR